MSTLQDMAFWGEKFCLHQYSSPHMCYTIKLYMNLIKLTNFSSLQFRVPKKFNSGLPYLRRGSLDYFQIDLILCFKVQNHVNKSQICWDLNTGTFYLQAPCAGQLHIIKGEPETNLQIKKSSISNQRALEHARELGY